MINIVVNSSDEYSTYCGVMLTSLFENNKNNSFCVYVLSTFIEEANKQLLLSLKERYGHEIVIKIVDDSYLKTLPVFFGYHSMAVYLRVMAANLLPKDVEKFLYLDCDIIINGDITELWNTDISNYALAATKDLPRFEPTYVKNLSLADNEYFNSGVMLVNTVYWRNNKISEKVLEYAKNNTDKIIACDQDAMNAIFSKSGKVLLMKRKWNVYPDVFFVKPDLYPEEMLEIDSIRKHPVVIHFMYKKPWFSNCVHPYKCFFERYYKIYKNEDFKDIISNHDVKFRLKRIICYVLYVMRVKEIYSMYDRRYYKGIKRISWI